MELLLLFISLGASVIGGICGIGGGIIIKPVLDLAGAASAATISFLSSCTVLSMSMYSVSLSFLTRSSVIETSAGTPLALGAAAGGLCGNMLFHFVCTAVGSDRAAGAAQALCLLVLTLGTLVYTLKKNVIKPRQVENRLASTGIGLSLGLLSSFLGIGGGPFNLVVLHYFYGMDTKRAAANSLYIILFSQIINLLVSLVSGSVPEFSGTALALMIAGGISGGVLGRCINKHIDSKTVDKLFVCLLVVIICICIYNAEKNLFFTQADVHLTGSWSTGQ